MKKHNKKNAVTVRNFEHKAEKIVSLALILTEEHIDTLKRPSPLCKAQALAALAVKHALETFITITKLDE